MFLFSFFVESAKIEKKLDTARMTIMHRAYLQTRLQTILTSIDKGAADPFFYTKQFEKEKNLSLVTIFNNGIDPDPAFSGSILGRIYLDSEKNICLATWPLSKEKNGSWRKEVLLSNVAYFEFEFLGKQSAVEHGQKEKIRPINASLAWRYTWPKTGREVPGIIRLRISEEASKEPIEYAFILPVSEPFVTYRERRAAI